MKKVNIKLMKKNISMIVVYCYLSLCCFFLSIFALSSKHYILSLIIAACIVLLYFICFSSDIYGIRINDKYIILHAERNRKKYLKEDIKNIKVWLKKTNKHYKVQIRIHLKNTYHKKDFIWDEIMISKAGTVRTKINQRNVNSYLALFKSIDKFYVHPIK